MCSISDAAAARERMALSTVRKEDGWLFSRMKKILIIYPYAIDPRLQEDDISVVPIGVYYVGAVLAEHGFDVEALNWYDANGRPEEIERALRDKKPDIIGFSILNANRWGAIDIARIAKRIDPRVVTVFGGVGATFLWEHFLTHFPEVDFVIRGEGEQSFLALANALGARKQELLENVPGLAFRKDGKIVANSEPCLIPSLDELPNPAKRFRFQHVASSRGCYGKCAFCGAPKMWRGKIRFHSPHAFVDQLEALYRNGISFFYFSDDTLTVNKQRIIDICKEILTRNLSVSWFAIARVDHIDEMTLYWMRKAGCIQISYGIESGSEKIRKALNKDLKTKDIVRAFELTRRYGIMARAYFIYGSPGETEETIQESIDLMKTIQPLSAIFYMLELFPGNQLYEDYQRKAGVNDDIWLKRIEGIQYYLTDPGMDQQTILSYGAKLRNAFHGSLHEFVDSIELIDDPELFPLHADFYSRLGMTFSHGDYSQIDAIRHSGEIAEKLFRKSLQYAPDHRAYLGLGIALQKRKKFEESVTLLTEGMNSWPDSVQLGACLGISYMNLREFQLALQTLEPFSRNPEVKPYLAATYRELGEHEKERALLSGK